MTNSKNHLRQVGVSEEQFILLLRRLEQEIEKDLQNNKMKKRGLSSKSMSIESKLHLTLAYLRHYPTFSNLGSIFGISESYANKIFHKTINYLLQFIHPKKTGNTNCNN